MALKPQARFHYHVINTFCYDNAMRGIIRIVCAVSAALVAEGPCLAESLPIRPDVNSPTAIACVHERMIMDGLGALYPENEQAFVPGGIVAFGNDNKDIWPPLFRMGLAPHETDGTSAYPFTVELDDETGEAHFRNVNGVLFYSVVPAYAATTEWFRMRLGVPTFGPLPAYRELSHIVSKWVLVHEEDVEAFVENQKDLRRKGQAQKAQGRKVQTREINGLAFTAFEMTGSEPPEYVFSFAWRSDAVSTDDVLDLYGASALTTNEWHRLASIAATNESPFVLTLSETNFPWYISPVACPRPGCTCPECVPVVVTNFTGSAFDPSATNLTMTIITNTVCDCPSGAPSGFFRIFRRADSDADGLLDAEEVLFHGTDPCSSDSDSDGLDDETEYLLGTNPLLADTDNDGLTDLEEVSLGTDPLDSDTDGDYLPDGWEADNGINPLDGMGANGTYGDPDGDSRINWFELQLSSHPLLADTDGDGIPDGASTNWFQHPRWASTTGWTNLVVSVDVLHPKNNSPRSAALKVGSLVIPLPAGHSIFSFSFQKGVSYDFNLACTGGTMARFAIEEAPTGGIWTDNPGCGSGTWENSCSGHVALPDLRLRDVNGETVINRCIHSGESGIELIATIQPAECEILLSQTSSFGLSNLANGHYKLLVGSTPGASATGRIVLTSPFLQAGIIEDFASGHRCLGAGLFCCGCASPDVRPVELELGTSLGPNDNRYACRLSNDPSRQPMVQCRIRLKNSAPSNPTFRLIGNKVRFMPGLLEQTDIEVPRDGSWTNFAISGQSESSVLNDASVRVADPMATDVICGAAPITVVWGSDFFIQDAQDQPFSFWNECQVKPIPPRTGLQFPTMAIQSISRVVEISAAVRPATLDGGVKFRRDCLESFVFTVDPSGTTNILENIHLVTRDPDGDDNPPLECTDGTPAFDGSVYDIDTPGLGIGLCDQYPVGTVFSVNYNFAEYLTFQDVRCSDDFHWYVRILFQRTSNGYAFINEPNSPWNNDGGFGNPSIPRP